MSALMLNAFTSYNIGTAIALRCCAHMETCLMLSVCKLVKETCREMCQLRRNSALRTISFKKTWPKTA
eukprot:16211653-Heterocapsa_arctica.AAC.1